MNYLAFLVASFLSFNQPDSINHIAEPLPAFLQNEFRSPVDIPIFLSGNFAEPRKAHFHTGLDIRTNEREGLNIYAVGDGYVSRINVSPVGYGNCLYITHPNGYTSVYAHLQSFNSTITARLRKEQFAQQKFQVDINLQPNEIIVKKGEIVALSGNSGGSGGPHLHFEIRDSFERPINPFHFGYKVADNVKPAINWVKFYPRSENRFAKETYRQMATPAGSGYTLNPSTILVNDTKVGVGVNTFDRMTGTSNVYGVYNLKLYDNEKLIYEYQLDRLSFDHKRAILSQCDYPVFLKEGSRAIHKMFVEPNNPLPAYKNLQNEGVIDLSDGALHQIKIVSSDFVGNAATLFFNIKYSETATLFKANNTNYNTFLSYKKPNTIEEKEEFTAAIPTKAIADSLPMKWNTALANPKLNYADMVVLGNSTDHLMDYYTLKLKLKSLPSQPDKALVTWKDEKGIWRSKGGKLENDWITTQTRELGTYTVGIDTVPPVIAPLNFSSNASFSLKNPMLLRVADNFSGVETYQAFIDENWVLMEYDAKFNVMKIKLANIGAGIHDLKVVVSDERKNTTIFTKKINFY